MAIILWFILPLIKLPTPVGSKVLQYGVYTASPLGIVIMAWGICFIWNCELEHASQSTPKSWNVDVG